MGKVTHSRIKYGTELKCRKSKPQYSDTLLGQFIPVIADSINEINTLNQRITAAKASAEKKIIKSDTAPTSPLIDDLWLDISTVPNVLKRWNGSAWEKGTPTAAGELVYSDGLTVEELKPAQAGADVTANNTAADTAAVNGTPAAIVISNINSASSTASAAQAAATNAQTTANSKAQTFTSQPVPPYNVGDIYQATNAVYICTTARAAGNYTSTDWTLVGDVTSSNTAKDTEAVNGLAASTISGWSYAGTTKINGGQIQAATVTAAQIAAGSITTDKLLIGNLANMIDNGTFEGDSAGSAPTGWTVTDGSTPTVVSSTASGVPTTGASGYTGNRGLNVLSVPVPTASNTAYNLYTSTWIPVNVGDVYFMQADAAVVGTATSAITVGLQTADQNKTANGYHSITGWTDANTTWTTNSGTIAVPSGVAYVRVLVIVHSPAAAVGAGTVYFDNIVLRPAITAEQIVSIDGGVIKAGTVDAGAIKGGTLALGGPSNGNGTAVLEDENGNQIVTMDSTGITVNGAGTFQNVTVEDATINSSTIGYQIKLQQQFKTASLPNTRLIFGDISLNPNGFHMGTFGNSAISTNDIESLGFMAWGSSIMTATQAIELAAFTANNWDTNSATSFEFDIYTPVVMSSNLTVGGTISRQDGASSYQTPTFQNGFTNYGSGYRNVQYYKDAMGIVHLTGLGRIGTAGSTIFTLPAGFRPSATLVFTTMSSGAIQRIDIASSGTVTLNGGGAFGNWVSLDGISFLAEQ
ncbi:hypothetical protein NZD89_05245 [Alicyclobacillus fastidiosus]|uniref:Uncharacterized protein n=1 Tax=Alicyclobacillus fastidiosus TaxID=392011 RepID=A0ABY6ZJ84_9BACL|nr:hypothetical protein [Alicyclobacillus fastidiosus]WAH42835.1 hypothetical protein NZD89_05245 [Alicyclobacillus fastidiosus]GMA64767.1 hypothetical protein GCM10025859_52070 [Alicyclobacillus fastidiosus]